MCLRDNNQTNEQKTAEHSEEIKHQEVGFSLPVNKICVLVK